MDEGSDELRGNDDGIGHIPVLLDEVIELLGFPRETPSGGPIVLDATLGRGGHALGILPTIPGGTLIGLDTDPENAAFARARLEPEAAAHGVTLHLFHRNFRQIRDVLAELELDGVDGLLADLGFASNQMDTPERGLQFRQDGPLDMRLDPTTGPTAAELLELLSESEIADLIYEFGEERYSRRIAAQIVRAREAGEPIRTTSSLAELVRRVYGPARFGKPHGQRPGKDASKRGKSAGRMPSKLDPATRTFMALRIAVNDELGALDDLLRDLPDLLRPGGRAAVISFHSLEDRRVKQRFAELASSGTNPDPNADPHTPFDHDPVNHQPIGKRLTRKPIVPGDDERYENSRSRSARLRGFERA